MDIYIYTDIYIYIYVPLLRCCSCWHTPAARVVLKDMQAAALLLPYRCRASTRQRRWHGADDSAPCQRYVYTREAGRRVMVAGAAGCCSVCCFMKHT